MKVKDLIAELQKHDPELPVALADWQEEYMDPSEWAAEIVSVGEYQYTSTGIDELNCPKKVVGQVVVIGG